MTVGIICEYNPFHNGHLYHLKKIKKQYPNSTIILVMSGNFTQRGEFSIINKWDKVDISLHYGVNLVIELPFKYATQSADYFAYGAINILKHLNVDKLIFGSESNDIELLTKIAKTQIDNPEFDKKVQEYLKDGINYPTALNKVINELIQTNISTPNDLLGISYIKEIIKQQANIKPITIQRTNDYHSTKLKSICSATAIREALKQNKDITQYIPKYCHKYIKPIFIDNYFDLIKYKILSTQDLTIYQGIDNGLDKRLKRYISKSLSLEEYIQLLKTKRYTHNRLKRLMVHILVGYTKEDNQKDYNYIRILGFNHKGQEYLHQHKKKLTIPLITNYSNSKGLLDLEYRVNKIIYLKLPDALNLINKEKQELIKY